MGLILLRTALIFITLLIVMRLMGKRQIGEMQPFELVITLLIAELACIPMADSSSPLLYGVISIITIFLLHQLMLIADLNSRGYKHLTLKEDGSICTSLDGANEETIQSTFSNFPAKVYWPQLAKVLEQEGLAATVEANCVSVAW